MVPEVGSLELLSNQMLRLCSMRLETEEIRKELFVPCGSPGFQQL